MGHLYELDLDMSRHVIYDKRYFGSSGGGENAVMDYMDQVQPLPVDPSPINYETSPKLLENIHQIDHTVYEAVLNLFDKVEVTFEYFGGKDTNGKFHGYSLLRFFPSQHCFRGHCQQVPYGSLKGYFEHGLLNDLVTMTSTDEWQMTFLALKKGIVHGMVITYGISRLFGQVHHLENKETLQQRGIGRIAKFLNGVQTQDNVWKGVLGIPLSNQGFLYGPLDDGKISGKDGAYIYPKGKLALVGQFDNDVMVKAQKAFINKAWCVNNVLLVEFSKPMGPILYLDAGTNHTLGTMPLTPDPYEAMTAKVGVSAVPHAGLGLFANRDVSENEILSYYNGFHYAHIQQCLNKECFKNKIGNYNAGEILDIPPVWDDLNLYNATLGHKVNHKFCPMTNAKFGFTEHPRFGAIISVYATKNIKHGQEIFVDYGYKDSIDQSLAPWYYKSAKLDHVT